MQVQSGGGHFGGHFVSIHKTIPKFERLIKYIKVAYMKIERSR